KSCSARMPYQFTSISYHVSPCRAARGCAWWLLCQPSPKVRSATHQLLVESSAVTKRRVPHRCVAELTSHVACKPNVTRRNRLHMNTDQPPNANSAAPTTMSGSQ